MAALVKKKKNLNSRTRNGFTVIFIKKDALNLVGGKTI